MLVTQAPPGVLFITPQPTRGNEGVLRSGRKLVQITNKVLLATLKAPLDFLDHCHKMAELEDLREVCKDRDTRATRTKPKRSTEDGDAKKSKMERVAAFIAKLMKELAAMFEELKAFFARQSTSCKESAAFQTQRAQLHTQSLKANTNPCVKYC